MRTAERLTLLVGLAILIAPLAAPHGALPDDLVDPLDREVRVWLDAGGDLATTAPADGGVTLAADGTPATWRTLVPIAGDAALRDLQLTVEADGVILPRSDDNGVLEVVTTVDGTPLEETRLVFEADGALDAGEPRTYSRATWAAGIDIDRGGAVGVAVQFVGTSTGDVRVLTGADASRLVVGVRAPDLDALGHAHDGWAHAPAGAPEPDGLVLDVELRHEGIQPTTLNAALGDRVVIRLDNAETTTHAAAHGPWGVDAPHRVHMEGLGLDETFGVYPGEVLFRHLNLTTTGTLTLTCTAGCAERGEARLTVADEVLGVTDEVHLQPQGYHEVNLQVADGADLTWRFATDPPTPITYDVHSHQGDDVIVHDKGTDTAANGTFAVPAAGTYSLLLQNTGDAATTIVYEVTGGTPVDAEAGEGGGFLGAIPGPAALLVILGVAVAAGTTRRRR